MDPRPITPERVDELLRFLPAFERTGRSFVSRWAGGETTAEGAVTTRYPVYAADVDDFFRLAGQECWLDPEYLAVDPAKMLADDGAVEVATLEQVRAMLTYCGRAERFGDGNWDALLRSGRVVALLRRLKVLRGEMTETQRPASATPPSRWTFPEPEANRPQKVSLATAAHGVVERGAEDWQFTNRPELSVVRKRVPPGSREPRHVHRSVRHFFFVLSGRAALELWGVVEELAPGEGLEVAPGEVHRLSNPGAVDLELLVVSQPNDQGDRLLVRDEQGNL